MQITIDNPRHHRGVRKATAALHASPLNTTHFGHGGARFQGRHDDSSTWVFRCHGCGDTIFIPAERPR